MSAFLIVVTGRKAKILVIDDDEGIRRVLSTFLEESGHLVDTAKDGDDAIQRAATSTYDHCRYCLFVTAMFNSHLPSL